MDPKESLLKMTKKKIHTRYERTKKHTKKEKELLSFNIYYITLLRPLVSGPGDDKTTTTHNNNNELTTEKTSIKTIQMSETTHTDDLRVYKSNRQ